MQNTVIDWKNVSYDDNQRKLVLVDQNLRHIPEAIINLYHNRVDCLDLSYNRLTTLDSLSLFSNVVEVILDNNSFSEMGTFPKELTDLKLLSLNNNQISNLDILLAKLSLCCPKLEYLSLLGNPVCSFYLSNEHFNEHQYQKYRLTIIRNLPALKFLDSREVSPTETETIQAEKEPKGNFERKISMQLIRILQVNWKKAEPKVYSPLPDSIREPGDHKGIYGKTRYRYVGAQSEGNRFIANNDL